MQTKTDIIMCIKQNDIQLQCKKFACHQNNNGLIISKQWKDNDYTVRSLKALQTDNTLLSNTTFQ